MSRRGASAPRRWLRVGGLAATLGLVSAGIVVDAQRSPATTRWVEVVDRTISELQDDMTAGRATARDVVAAHLARIEAYDTAGPALNAFITRNPRALDEADALDRERRARGPRGPLHGIPVVVKDNYETADLPTTGGSVALAGFRTGRDAFLVKKLRDAGVVVLGKTNLHELAAGIITVSSMGGQTRNPYDLARTPGGSSGGTAAAVAASFAPGGLASDTCGSIRIPAANNNLFGLRGTQGSSSRTGIIPLSHSQDIGGPLARTVTDLALLLDATVGEDPADPSTAASRGRGANGFRQRLATDALRGARIGLLTNHFGTAPEDEEVNTLVRSAVDQLRAQGATVVEVTVPGLDELLNASSLINLEFKTDLAAYLARFPQAPVRSLQEILDRGAFHAALETTFRLRNAAVPDPDEIRRVEQRRTAVTALMQGALTDQRLDAFVYPTLRRRPVVVEEPQRGSNCQLSATTGWPAMAMPAGFTDDGVPVGFELLGPAWSDTRLVAMAYAYEQAARPRRTPPTTPPLVEGRPPQPQTFTVSGRLADADVRVAFEYDPVSGRLRYELPAGVGAASLHRSTPAPLGPVVHRLWSPATPSRVTGEVTLPPYQRPWLAAGGLQLSLQSGGARVVLPLRPEAR